MVPNITETTDAKNLSSISCYISTTKNHAADSEISVLANGFPNYELLHTLIQLTKTSDP